MEEVRSLEMYNTVQKKISYVYIFCSVNTKRKNRLLDEGNNNV